jgi:hypothetical protein
MATFAKATFAKATDARPASDLAQRALSGTGPFDMPK